MEWKTLQNYNKIALPAEAGGDPYRAKAGSLFDRYDPANKNYIGRYKQDLLERKRLARIKTNRPEGSKPSWQKGTITNGIQEWNFN